MLWKVCFFFSINWSFPNTNHVCSYIVVCLKAGFKSTSVDNKPWYYWVCMEVNADLYWSNVILLFFFRNKRIANYAHFYDNMGLTCDLPRRKRIRIDLWKVKAYLCTWCFCFCWAHDQRRPKRLHLQLWKSHIFIVPQKMVYHNMKWLTSEWKNFMCYTSLVHNIVEPCIWRRDKGFIAINSTV